MKQIAALVFLVALAGCSVTSPSKNQTETFTGTLQPGGAAGKQIQSSNGEYHITLDALLPTNALLVLQLWQGNCQSGVPINSTYTTVSSVGLSGIIVSGTYCIVLLDQGALAQPSTFTVTISHP